VPVETTLMHNNRVLWVTYSGNVSGDDVQYSVQQFIAACNESSHTLHSINDARTMINVPPNILSLIQSPSSPLLHPKRGKAIIITNNEIMRATISSVTRLVPDAPYQCVRTPDEAWAMIRRVLAAEDIVTEE
jgi:hypothetical protein